MLLAIGDYFFIPLFYGGIAGVLARFLTDLVLPSAPASTVGVVVGIGVAIAAVLLAWTDRHGDPHTEGDFLERSAERERTYEQRFPR